jgi:hypothetical protein
MEKIKRPPTAVFICICLIPFINGCKKGDDDPVFSFRTRKNRVEGEWKLTYSATHLNYSRNGGYNNNMEAFVCDSSAELKNNEIISLATGSITYQYGSTTQYTNDARGIVTCKLIFTKEGTFTQTTETTRLDVVVDEKNYYAPNPVTTVLSYVTVHEKKGMWQFVTIKADDFKKKERISLNILEENISGTKGDGFTVDTYSVRKKYEMGELVEVWKIRELRKRKMVLEKELNLQDIYDAARTVMSAPSYNYSRDVIQSGHVSITYEQ